jgi:type II secretory pathway component PulC
MKKIILCTLWFILYNIWLGICYAQESNQPFSYYEIIEQRNFFRPKKEELKDKKKIIEQGFISKKPATETSDLILTGVVKINGRYKAIIEKKTQDEGFYVETNERVENYIVTEIRQDEIYLTKEGQTFVLKLKITPSIQQKEAPFDNNLTVQPQKNEQDSLENMRFEENIIQKIRMGGQ